MKTIAPNIIIDSREQLPYSFKHPSEIKALKTGDYSIVGLENSVVVERKRHSEFIQCLSGERERFQRELERGQSLHRLFVVVEASFKGVIECLYEDWPSGMHKNAIRGTIAAWENRYNHVRFHFCGDRDTAQSWTEHLLKRSWADFQEGKIQQETHHGSK